MSIPITDESFGVIPLKKENNKWLVLILKQRAGHWSFPKGHKNNVLETPIDAAQRELFEETGFKVKKFLFPETLQETYFVGENNETKKTVTYFIALVEGDMKLCHVEVESALWINLDEIFKTIDLKESKHQLIEELKILLSSLF